MNSGGRMDEGDVGESSPCDIPMVSRAVQEGHVPVHSTENVKYFEDGAPLRCPIFIQDFELASTRFTGLGITPKQFAQLPRVVWAGVRPHFNCAACFDCCRTDFSMKIVSGVPVLLTCNYLFERAKPGEPMDASDEVVLTIEIHDNRKSNTETQELTIRAMDGLTTLKDEIYCVYEHTLGKDESLTAGADYFLIKSVYYIDMRRQNALDYTIPTRQFLSLSAVNMAGVPLMKTPCRLGEAFTYCHLKTCRHTLTVREMRLAPPQANYPVQSFLRDSRPEKCSVCREHEAKKVVVNEKYSPLGMSPSLFCLDCYNQLEVSVDGEFIDSKFIVHDYLDQLVPRGSSMG